MLRVDDIDSGTLILFLLLPVILLVVAFAGMAFLLRSMGFRPVASEPEEERSEWERLPRPWWGNPLVWLAVSAVLVLLGLFVAPHFLGGIFLFLPFLWIGRWRRRPGATGTCPRCGTRLEPDDKTCPQCGARVR